LILNTGKRAKVGTYVVENDEYECLKCTMNKVINALSFFLRESPGGLFIEVVRSPITMSEPLLIVPFTLSIQL
jgi:hypothetical protein